MDRPLLIYFIGTPGSGKTYFATQLAKKLNAVHLSSDAARIAMFGSNEEVERIRATKRRFVLNTQVFGVLDYAARQALVASSSVIYDAQATKRSNRKRLEKMAHESSAVPVLVWVETPPELAIERGQTRESRDDSIPYSEEKMRELISYFSGSLDEPNEDENLIRISGEVPFAEQYSSFKSQLEKTTRVGHSHE